MTARRVTRLVALIVALVCCCQVVDGLRVRKSWRAFSQAERDAFTEALTRAMTTGTHLLFTKLTMDPASLPRVLGTAAEPAWHRRWLLGYENMLRDQGEAFTNVTLPYWDVFEDSAMRLSSRCRCSSIETCSSYLTALGGSTGSDYRTAYFVNGQFAYGNCVNRSVAASACTDRGRREGCEQCIPRGDWNIPFSTVEFGPSAFVEVLRLAASSPTPMETLRVELSTRFHYNLHNLLGGVYETRAAAFDPIYLGHYALVDLVYTIHQRCHPASSAFINETTTTNDGESLTTSSEIPMLVDGVRVEEHPELAKYFLKQGPTFADLDDPRSIGDGGYDYEIDGFLRRLLEDFDIDCPKPTDPADWLRFVEEQVAPDANQTAGIQFAHAMAVCANASLDGETREAPYTAVVCELMAKEQNGVFTSFSSTLRHARNLPPTLMPTCVGMLQAIASGSARVRAPESCRRAFLDETSINTNEFHTATEGFTVVSRGRDGVVTRYNGTARSP